MAFDGITVSALFSEFKCEILGGRIQKISQPEKDEIILLIKGVSETKRLLLSANPSLPLMNFISYNKTSYTNAPSFLMVLRKFIGGGKIVGINRPSLERCVEFEIERYNDLGDLNTVKLIIELMGKYSNIILTDNNNIIIDAIKHIGANTSSLREVLPKKNYFIPKELIKNNPFEISRDKFKEIISENNDKITRNLTTNFAGISSIVANEILYRSGIDYDLTYNDLNDIQIENLTSNFILLLSNIKDEKFEPIIYYNKEKLVEYSAIKLEQFSDLEVKTYSSISALIEDYYSEKAQTNRIKQKSIDLRKIVSNLLERSVKKFSIQNNQLDDCAKMDKFKLYGELLLTYSNNINASQNKIDVLNYYTNETISIPIDNKISAMDNSNKYFAKYNKLKRTYSALLSQVEDTKKEIEILKSIKQSLELAENDLDLNDIRSELIDLGFIKNKSKSTQNRKNKIKGGKPIHYRYNDSFEIFVGKNNIQNDYLCFKVANKNDWWFHVKNNHGSHVILKSNNDEIPDELFEICASLAAYYSEMKLQDKVEVDYTHVKELKKVKSGAPGFVIYHQNYSIYVTPEINDKLEHMFD